MHNNFIIIELWDKKISGPADQIIGIIKIPLEQFYTSFKDKQISRVLLRAQYPVISTDAWLPIIDPFTSTNKSHGEIQVLLAMGTSDQITAIQVAHAGGDLVPSSTHKKPAISHHDQSSSLIEHHFEILIESINGLRAFESMVWGESDCFIQYSFPTQQEQLPNTNSIKPFQLRSIRTAATLCTSDPTFHDSNKFRYILSPADALHKYFYAGKIILFFSVLENRTFSFSLSSTIDG
jgi:C2 domain-containing protein 3